MQLTKGQRLTLLAIDNVLGFTHRIELEVRHCPEQPMAWIPDPNRLYLGQGARRGKRKLQDIVVSHDDIVLDGWDLGFRADSEAGGCIHGNACFNLVGDPELIRSHIETALQCSDDARSRIIVSPQPLVNSNEEGDLLFPMIPTGHAVIVAMKERIGLPTRPESTAPAGWQQV